VIAAGQHVHAVSEQLVGQRRSNAKSAGGVLPIGDGQMDVLRGHDPAQMPRHQVASGGRKDVADKKKIGNSGS
jgi:hypothetical protein